MHLDNTIGHSNLAYVRLAYERTDGMGVDGEAAEAGTGRDRNASGISETEALVSCCRSNNIMLSGSHCQQMLASQICDGIFGETIQ